MTGAGSAVGAWERVPDMGDAGADDCSGVNLIDGVEIDWGMNGS